MGNLSTHGDQFRDANGTAVVLRGVNLGGWLHMENFITGFPDTEARMRAALRRTIGERRTGLFFDRLRETFNVFDRKESTIAELLERMVETGELSRYEPGPAPET